MFVAIEGIEGCGKTTLLAGLKAAFERDAREVVYVREPGGTPIGDRIRTLFLDRENQPIDARTELLLVNASRAQLVRDVIQPALAAGKAVVADRFIYSTLAYQGYGRGLDLDVVRSACDIATGGLRADLTLLLDVSLATSRARMGERASHADRIELEDAAFHKRVHGGFLALAKSQPDIVRIDAERSPKDVLAAALSAIQSRAGAHG